MYARSWTIDLTDYSFFTEWPRFRVKNLLEFYAMELNYNFVIEPEINGKEFRRGKH